MQVFFPLPILFLVWLDVATGNNLQSLFNPFKNVSSEYNITIKENLSLSLVNYEGIGENILYSYTMMKSPEYCSISQPHLTMLTEKKSSNMAKKNYYKMYLTEHRLLFLFLEEESMRLNESNKFQLYRVDVSNQTESNFLRPVFFQTDNDTTEFIIPNCKTRINHIEQYKDYIVLTNEEKIYVYRFWEKINDANLKASATFDFINSFVLQLGNKRWRVLCFLTIDCFLAVKEADDLLVFYKLEALLGKKEGELIEKNTSTYQLRADRIFFDFEASSDSLYLLNSDYIQVYIKRSEEFFKSDTIPCKSDVGQAQALKVSGRSLLILYQNFTEEYLLVSHSGDFLLHRTIRYTHKSSVIPLSRYYLVYDNINTVSVYFLQRVIFNFTSQQTPFSVFTERNAGMIAAKDGIMNGFFPHLADFLFVSLDMENFQLQSKYFTFQEPNLTCAPPKGKNEPFEVTVELRALFCNQYLLKRGNNSSSFVNHTLMPLDPDFESCTYYKTFKVKFQDDSVILNIDLIIGLSVGGAVLLILALAVTKCLFLIEKRKEKFKDHQIDEDLEGVTDRKYGPMESARTNPLTSQRGHQSEREEYLSSARGLFNLSSNRGERVEASLLKSNKKTKNLDQAKALKDQAKSSKNETKGLGKKTQKKTDKTKLKRVIKNKKVEVLD